jgi:parallel beta-helix repeat protein
MKVLRQLPALRVLGLLVLALAVPSCHFDDRVNALDWFVDPGFGDDFNGNGTSWFPFRTITRALHFSISGDAIFLARGTYGASSGEVFPIRVKPGVIIQGDPATKGLGPGATFVNGGGVYTVSGGSQASTTVTAAFVMGTGSALSGVKITVAGAGGVGVVFDGFSASVSSCTITGNGASGIRVYQTGSPTITGNVISSNGASGVDVFDAAGPILRQNSISSNTTDGVVANDTSTPNLGDATSAGANTLQANTGVGLNNNTTASTIQAVGNTWVLSMQGSDGSGNYAAALTPGAVAPAAGNNFAIISALPGAAIQF